VGVERVERREIIDSLRNSPAAAGAERAAAAVVDEAEVLTLRGAARRRAPADADQSQ